MDHFYNVREARDRLQRLSEQALEYNAKSCEAKDGSSIDYLADTEVLKGNNFTVTEFHRPKVWKICYREADGPNDEEAAFRVQGVLCGKDLPPVQIQGGAQSALRARRYLRQNAKITGLGGLTFQQTQRTLESAYLMFCNALPEGTVEDYQPSSYGADSAIEANTRYFTHRTASSDSTISAPFLEGVDPDGKLTILMGNEFVHTEDNQVQYLHIAPDGHGSRYATIPPSNFRIGDIVEATIGISCVPTKNGKCKMMLSLRALVLLDQEDRNNATILRMQSRYRSSPEGELPTRSRKRRLQYIPEEGEITSTETRMTRMRID